MSSSSSSSTNVARFVTNTMCPFAQKAWIALEVTKTPYHLEEIALYGAGGKPNWFWKLNPQGTVPVLVTKDGIVLADSEDILDHLQGPTAPPPLSSQWRSNINQKLLPAGKQAVLQGNEMRLKSVLRELDDALTSKFLTGDAVSIADCHAFPFVWRVHQEYEAMMKEEFPHLSQWMERCAVLPAFRKTIRRSWWWWW